MARFNIYILVAGYLLMAAGATAQHIEFSGSRGNVLEIYPDFPKSEGSLRGEIAWFPVIKDSALWNRAFKNPSAGLKISYMNLGSNVLGNAWGLQYIFLQERKISGKLNFRWGLGMGGVYFDNPYHFIDNRENIVNGSKFAFLMELNLGTSYRFSDQFAAFAAFNLYHSSNGHTRLPNVGLNVPALQVGLRYHLKPATQVLSPPQPEEWNKDWKFGCRISLGINEFGRATAPTHGPRQHIYLTSLYVSRRYLAKARWIAGVDAYYNKGYRNYIISQEPAGLEDRFTSASVLIIFIGHEYIYGHYGLMVQAGYYLHNPFLKYYVKKDESGNSSSLKAILPGKFGVNYYLFNPYEEPDFNVYFGVFIKSNVSQADFLETGIGILF